MLINRRPVCRLQKLNPEPRPFVTRPLQHRGSNLSMARGNRRPLDEGGSLAISTTVRKAVNCMKELADLGGLASASEIAARVGISRPGATRLLETLVLTGLLSFDEASKQYGFGLRVYEWGALANPTRRLMPIIRREAVKHWPGWGGRIAAAAGLAVIVGSLARTNFHDYFVTFRDQYDMSATNPSEIGTVVRAFVAGGVSPDSVWLKGFPYWLDARAVALESFDSFDWQNAVLDPEELTRAGDDARPKLFIVHIWDQPAIAKLRELYPNGILANHTSPTPGKDFLTYFVPGAEDFDENTLPTPPGASLSPGRS